MSKPSDDLAAAMLEFETRSWSSPHQKERAIRARFGISPVRYYQRLWALIDDVRAEQLDPMVVHRLRRVREAGLAARARRQPSRSTVAV